MKGQLRAGVRIGLALFSCCTVCAADQSATTGQVDEARLQAILGKLDLSDRVSLLGGASSFGTTAIIKAGIHSMRFADGPNGVRSNEGDEATAFPVGITLASTWNPALVQQVGEAIGEEVHALGDHVLLGPNLNLVRSPLSGRNFETFGEDPLLAGELAVSFINGLQSKGVAATVKHFVGNEQETERNLGNSIIDPRALSELYLKPFVMAIREAHPWALMTAYNRTNGTYMSENSELVRKVLKEKWGFDGVVMSDWGGTHSTFALTAGLDLEMPGPAFHFGDALRSAVNLFQVPSAAVDAAALRMLRLAARVGALDHDLQPQGEVSTAMHRVLARTAAAQAITLLKNQDAALPLDINAVHKLAVIGPNADTLVIEGGGSAQVIPSDLVSPLDAIKQLVGNAVSVRYERGVDNEQYTPALDGRDVSPMLDRTQQGLSVRYWANSKFAGKPAKARVEKNFNALILADDVNTLGKGSLSAKWDGYFWPRVTGEYEFEMENLRAIEGTTLYFDNPEVHAQVKLDGKLLLSPKTTMLDERSTSFFPTELRRARIKLTAGKPVHIQVEYSGRDCRLHNFRLGVRQPLNGIDAAVAAARDADAVLLFVGSGTTAETEGRDRTSMNLAGDQDALVKAVAAVNPRTVVVLHNGAPIAMPWVDQVPAIVEAWLPGQEGNLALADVLFGKINPSGKLPVTFPKRVQDSPSYPFYPGYRDAFYGESIFMGYRYYDKKDIEPLFPFGHGLSYTQFAYSDLQLPAQVKQNEPLTVSVTVKNTGARAGAEVIQWYVTDTHCEEACPVRELKQFSRVNLQPGESRMVSATLPVDGLMHFDAEENIWRAEAGSFVVAAGSSSRDLRVQGTLVLQ
jgi:beta-glucosidase